MLLIALLMVGCSPAKPAHDSKSPAPTGSPLASAAPSAQASAKPTAPPAAPGKSCCEEKCSSEEQFAWDVCDGSELAKKIADEWQGLLTGYKYPRNAAVEHLKTATVYVSQNGPGLSKCEGQDQPDCLVVYTDEKAAKHSCDVPNPKAVSFQDIVKQAAASKQTITIGCLQFFKGIRVSELGTYTK